MKFKVIIPFLACLLYGSNVFPQINIFVGTGFGYEYKAIEAIENDFFFGQNREIIYVRAVELGAGIKLEKNIEIGGNFSYTWAILNPVGQFPGQSKISNIGWASVGGWGKYILLPHKRLQFAVQASVGAHIGYPKRMNVDTIERQVAFYAGLHGGPQYKFSDKFMVSYYYGRGKFRNMLLLTYSISTKTTK